MNLLTFIDLATKTQSQEKSGSSQDKDAVCRAALAAFLADSDCDIRQAVLFDFLYDFGIFLAQKYVKAYSSATNREILRTLRKWLRLAIAQGLVPNIDLVPAVISRLDAEIWSDSAPSAKTTTKEAKKTTAKSAKSGAKAAKSDAEAKTGAQAALRLDLKAKASVTSVAKNVDTWAIRQSMGILPKASDREAREIALQTHCAAIYLFCLLTYGIEIRDALDIKCDRAGDEVPDKVYIERLGITFPLCDQAKKLVKFYNKGAICREHLFYTLDSDRYKADPDKAARIIQEHIAKYLHRQKLPLFLKQSVFTDWLNFAIESGLSDADAQALWKAYIGMGDAPISALDAAQTTFSVSRHSYEESWYLLCLLPLSARRDKFVKMFVSAGILGTERESALRIYAPEEKFINKDKGQVAVFSRYIFFRATPLQAEFANTYSPNAYVFKNRASRTFAKIPKQDIEHLRETLRDFPDLVEMTDGSEWLKDHNAEIMEGCKAIIRSGSLAGREAKVIRVKGKEGDKLSFLLEFVEGALRFQTSLEGIELDIVNSKQ